MILKLDYSNLEDVIGKSNKLCNEYDDYSQALKNKVQKKIHNVDGGMSSNLNNADYFINTKIRQIDERESEVRALGSSCETLLDTAKRVDKNVADTIKRNQNQFFSKNPELKPSTAKVALYTFWTDLKKTPLIGIYLKAYEATVDALSELKEEIVYWWECNGGESVVMNGLDIVVKIGAAIVAVVTAVAAVAAIIGATVVTGGMILVAVAAVILATIAIADAVANTVTSVKSIVAYRQNDYAMARLYEDQDKSTDVLRFTNFHNKWLNNMSFTASRTIDITEKIASMVLLVNTGMKVFGKVGTKLGIDSAFKQKVLTPTGLKDKVTLQSFWKGTKAFITNSKFNSDISTGLRTTAFENFKTYAKLDYKLFKMALSDPKSYLDAKKLTRMAPGNIVEQLDIFKKNIKGITTGFEITKFTLKAMDDDGFWGGVNEVAASRTKEFLFSDLTSEVLKITGLGKTLIGWEQSGNLEKYTGFSGGFIQASKDLYDTITKKTATYKHPYYLDYGL